MDDEITRSRRTPVDYTQVLRSTLAWLATIALLSAAGYWAWHQPFMARPRALWELSRLPPPASLAMPVEGVAPARVADTFGAARGKDRSHAGVDIFAPRGTPVLSATRGVVAAIQEGGLGGKQVWIIGPARERHYYAHLDAWTKDLAVGQVVMPGDRLGSVGDSGNAQGTPPHLHYGIYGANGAYDPLPLLRARGGGADPRAGR
ncbi:M23 family metallopeptidase [Luteimonas vadosa]|uniref:M23 family metallopeptidase n=1 Tax=Luteimonas vadosa TaxID=1165507 RepID=A0ABP9DW29_9GAMM